MRMNYTPSAVAQGQVNKAKAQEQPNTFFTSSGIDQISQQSSLDVPKQRMAGQFGHRALEYMNDPMEQERTDTWMELFGQSNEGMEFNQAKIDGGPPVA